MKLFYSLSISSEQMGRFFEIIIEKCNRMRICLLDINNRTINYIFILL